ncbi:MAG: hypothetical protein A3J28_18070 [Acidobacteria bacterium RIFCSPLOWO2_12_FULL_60_22]|nr:MAG: hypothetical protein A3J28_18070 [Acidobacteria bacterium RIFCSPLOWO2_12_FULL_60_22]
MADRIQTKPRELPEEEIFSPDRAAALPRVQSRLRWILLPVLLAAALGIFALWQYSAVRETTDDAQIEGHIHPIGAKVGGSVIRVQVENNQVVEAGEVLVEMDPRDYQVALDRAQGDLAEAEALWRASQAEVPVASETTTSRLSDTQAGVEEAGASLRVAQQETEAARARLLVAQARLRESAANSEKAARDLDRMKQLIAEGAISQQQYDGTVAAADSLRAAGEAARASVTDAELGIQAAQSRVAREQAKLAQSKAAVQAAQTAPQQVAAMRARADSARGKWEQAKAMVAQAQLHLEYATLKAPVSGIVSKKNVEVGQIVQPGQPLLALVPLDTIWVTANFKETQLRNMRPGQRVILSVDAYGGRKYEGHVHSIAAATGARFSLLPPENATGNYVKVVQRVPVRIVLEKGQDPEHLLRPGMSVVPTVMTK